MLVFTYMNPQRKKRLERNIIAGLTVPFFTITMRRKKAKFDFNQ